MIANSLSITIAQRTREFATLRTLGASRRQVRFSVLVESLAIGTLASVVGLFLGLALAKGLFWLFTTFGFTLPNNGLPVQPANDRRLAAGRDPRDRAREPAARVPGDARASDRRRAGGRRRFRPAGSPASAIVGAILVAALGFALVLIGLFVAHGTAGVLLSMLIGALLVFIGVSLFASQLVRPLASVLGWPAARLGWRRRWARP